MEHNRRLEDEVQHLRDKARRSDMLADEYEVGVFFDKRLPDSVYSGKTFEDWRPTADPKALELSRMRFGAGLTTSVDVATAQGALAEAEDAEIRTRYEWYAAEARLARAEGDVYWFFERGR